MTAVLGISVLVLYEQKLKAFLADLSAEESSTLEASTSNGGFAYGSQKAD